MSGGIFQLVADGPADWFWYGYGRNGQTIESYTRQIVVWKKKDYKFKHVHDKSISDNQWYSKYYHKQYKDYTFTQKFYNYTRGTMYLAYE